MKFSLVIPEIVEVEIEEAATYYNKQQDGLANSLYRDLTETLSFIEKNPFTFQKTQKDYKQALLNKFPYLIIYKVYENEILFFKFINAKKHPAKRHKNNENKIA